MLWHIDTLGNKGQYLKLWFLNKPSEKNKDINNKKSLKSNTLDNYYEKRLVSIIPNIYVWYSNYTIVIPSIFILVSIDTKRYSPYISE